MRLRPRRRVAVDFLDRRSICRATAAAAASLFRCAMGRDFAPPPRRPRRSAWAPAVAGDATAGLAQRVSPLPPRPRAHVCACVHMWACCLSNCACAGALPRLGVLGRYLTDIQRDPDGHAAHMRAGTWDVLQAEACAHAKGGGTRGREARMRRRKPRCVCASGKEGL